MLLGCAYFFFLFSSYFILRPIRDAMAVASGISKLPWLFAGTLGAMLLANPIFSALVVRFPVRRFIVITYQFFALNLIGFDVGYPRPPLMPLAETAVAAVREALHALQGSLV